MKGGSRTLTRPSLRHALVLAAAVGLLAVAAPSAMAEGEIVLPPKETGAGPGDVSDEPDTTPDTEDPGNLFPFKDFKPQEPRLILDGHYLYEPFPLDVDVNQIVDELSEGAGEGEQQDRMILGFGYFEAWWGWWFDKGQNARMTSYAGETGPPDGAIQDAHDDPSNWDEGSFHYGNWDEFLWRGENPWVQDHQFFGIGAPDSTIDRYPGDEMYLFIDPGTYQPHARQMIIPGNENSAFILRDDKDARDVPDMEYIDNTDQGPFASPGNPQDGGWDTENRRPTGIYDAGMLITTEVHTSVNPTGGPFTFDPQSGTAYDMDRFEAIHPQVEVLYRTAVWDPHDEREDNVGEEFGWDEGPKGKLTEEFTDAWLEGDDRFIDGVDTLTDPMSPATGPTDDAAGQKAWRHEPNEPGDQYGVSETWAQHDPATSYAGLADTGDYYQPGSGQTYDGYAPGSGGEHAWVDAQPGWGVPLYFFNFNMFGTFNLRTVHSPSGLAGGGDAPGIPPGILGVSAHFGTWWDDNADTWVGDVTEQGRWADDGDPYNGGVGDAFGAPDDPFYQDRRDDPNDYTDTPSKTQTDPTKSFPAEWRPFCSSGTVSATLTPLTDGQRWGQAGVYVVHDSDGRGNPYDDVATDAVDDQSRLVLEGSIDMDLRCRDAETGLWFGDTWIVSPTGTADYPVQVETTAQVDTDRMGQHGSTVGKSLKGETVIDVDVLGSFQGDGD